MLEPEEQTRSLKEQSAWLLAAKMMGFAFAFLLPLVIVRSLSQEAVGRYREAFQVITNAIVILPLGLSMSAYYFLSRDRERRGSTVLNILIFNFVIGGISFAVFALFPQILGSLFRSDELAALSPLIGVVIWIWMFSTFLETVAVANQEARTATFLIVGAQLSKTALMGMAVLAFATVEAFLYAAIVQGIIQTAILFWYLRSRFPRFWRCFDPGFFREQITYALPFGIAGILWMAQNDIHHYFVGYGFSSADFAIYAYGCFEVPLIAMLSESVTSVLMPRMNALQLAGDRDEMIRLTARAMQKLALVYFPVYAFLFVTAQTFIITLFTRTYEQSASIFVINITLLPFAILITDPIVRSFKELGRIFLLTRIGVLCGLIGVLYYGLGSFGLIGVITSAVAAILIEKAIAETMVIRKLGLGRQHLPMLSPVAKTAIVSLIAGVATWFVYSNIKEPVLAIGEHFAEDVLHTHQIAVLNFFGGSMVLAISAAVFVPIYILGANFLGLIEQQDRQSARDFFGRIVPQARRRVAVAE
jgi:O-antigen/teichoic acid export membrane protein